jgi:hypothetical protein
MLIERDQPTRRYDLVPGCMAVFYLAGLGRSGERAERFLYQARFAPAQPRSRYRSSSRQLL